MIIYFPQIWCAAGVNLTGGRTRDGGSIVGASVFYSNPPVEDKDDADPKSEVEKLDKELKVSIFIGFKEVTMQGVIVIKKKMDDVKKNVQK